MNRLVAVGRLRRWSENDLERWFKDAGSGSLERTWEIRQAEAPCPHTESVMASQCCCAEPQQDSERCSACGENTGFELVCRACRELTA